MLNAIRENRDYVLLIVLWAVVVMAMIVILWPVMTTKPGLDRICAVESNITQQCIDWRVDQCLATERYTLGMCVELVGK